MSGTSATEPEGIPRPPRSLRRTFAAMVLVGEVLVVGFAALVARGVSDVPGSTIGVAAAAVAALCLLAAGTLRSPVGYGLGWLVQALLVASAFWVPQMLVVGIVFAGLWLLALVQGRRADVVTAQRQAATRRPGQSAPPTAT